MKKETYLRLAHRAGCIRKKHRFTPLEAAWSVLWLAGAEEGNISRLAAEMDRLRQEKETRKYEKRN